jgi:hypothetical protein
MFDYVLHAAEYVFTEAGRRTAFAVCVSDVRLLVITYEQFEQLYFSKSGIRSLSRSSHRAPLRDKSYGPGRRRRFGDWLKAGGYGRQSVCTGRNAIGYIDSGFPSWRP